MVDRLSAGDICTRIVSFAYRGNSIAEAAGLMRAHHVGSLVVVDERPQGRVVVGMLTDRDIVTAIVARGVDPAKVPVGDAMSAELVTAREQDSMLDLLQTMRRKGLRRLPVVDARGVLVGLVALDDLVGVIAEQLQLVAKVFDSALVRESRTRPPRPALGEEAGPGAAPSAGGLDAGGGAAPDSDAARIVLRPDGFHWLSPDGKQEFGPFESVDDARREMTEADEGAPEPGETLQEAEREIGIAEWIDPDTGEPAEGGCPPRLAPE